MYSSENLVIIGSGNGFLPVWLQATATNADLPIVNWNSGRKFNGILMELKHFHSRKCIRKYCQQNVSHFAQD